MVKITW